MEEKERRRGIAGARLYSKPRGGVGLRTQRDGASMVSRGNAKYTVQGKIKWWDFIEIFI